MKMENDLNKTNAELKQKSIERSKLQGELETLLVELRRRELTMQAHVARELDNDGKPKFRNETIRAAEAMKRNNEDKTFQESKAKHNELVGKVNELNFEIEFLRNKLLIGLALLNNSTASMKEKTG